MNVFHLLLVGISLSAFAGVSYLYSKRAFIGGVVVRNIVHFIVYFMAYTALYIWIDDPTTIEMVGIVTIIVLISWIFGHFGRLARK